MYKKIIAMCLCLGLLLSGCQLAQTEETKTTQGDTLESPVQIERLAGAYITLEPIVLEAGTDRIQAQKSLSSRSVGYRSCSFLCRTDFRCPLLIPPFVNPFPWVSEHWLRHSPALALGSRLCSCESACPQQW